MPTDPRSRSTSPSPTSSPKERFLDLPDFGCVAWVEDGTIFTMEAGEFKDLVGRPGGEDLAIFAAIEVTDPGSQDFLDAINSATGSEFTLADFGGGSDA